MNRRETILAALAVPAVTVPAIAAQRTDDEAWQLGVGIAREMILHSGGDGRDHLDDMAMEGDYRGGRPQRNVVWFYLRKLREINDDRVDAAFGAVASDYIACWASGWYGHEYLDRVTAAPIAMVCAREVQS